MDTYNELPNNFTDNDLTDVELNSAIAPNDQQGVDSEDLYKYKKISVFIPKLVTTIEQLEMLDRNLELTKSRKRLASIVIDNTNPNDEDIKDFISALASALYELSDGMRLMGVENMIQVNKDRALDLFADISLIQEDIVKLAS